MAGEVALVTNARHYTLINYSVTLKHHWLIINMGWPDDRSKDASVKQPWANVIHCSYIGSSYHWNLSLETGKKDFLNRNFFQHTRAHTCMRAHIHHAHGCTPTYTHSLTQSYSNLAYLQGIPDIYGIRYGIYLYGIENMEYGRVFSC